MKKTPIKIQMLGGFSISDGDSSMDELTTRSPKFWRLLQYLIVFRHRSIPQEELLSAIWPGDKNSDPIGAVRNMVFRVRSALAASGITDGKEMVLYSGGGYAWNNSAVCIIDFEEFEALYQESCAAGLPEEKRLELLFEAIGLYKGDFLPSACGELWSVPLVSYYKSLYFKCVHAALDLLMRRKMYPQAEMLVKKVLLIDRLDETVHICHLRCLIMQGKLAEALQEYQKVETLFYEELGANPSDAMRELYLEIQRAYRASDRPLEDIIREWVDSAHFSGAYYCTYGLFKIICQIEARSVERSGRPVYIISFEVGDVDKKAADIIRNLHIAIQHSLRMGDLFTRSAPNQYMLLLHDLTSQNCRMLTKRILRAMDKKYHSVPMKKTIKQLLSTR